MVLYFSELCFLLSHLELFFDAAGGVKPLCVVLVWFLSFSVELDWAEGLPCTDRGRGKWSSFTRLKIKHLTGSFLRQQLSWFNDHTKNTFAHISEVPHSAHPCTWNLCIALVWHVCWIFAESKKCVFVTWLWDLTYSNSPVHLRHTNQSHDKNSPKNAWPKLFWPLEMLCAVFFPICQDHSSGIVCLQGPEKCPIWGDLDMN